MAKGLNSYALPGKPIGKEDFKKWIEYTEGSPTVGITEAKQRWATQKKKLHYYLFYKIIKETPVSI